MGYFKKFRSLRGAIWRSFLKLIFKNYFLFFNLKIVFKSKFQKTWSKENMTMLDMLT